MTPAESLVERLYSEDPIDTGDRRRLARLLEAVQSSFRFGEESPGDTVIGATAWSTVRAEYQRDFVHDITGDLG